MKKIFTLILVLFSIVIVRAQVILNEFYATPNNGRHEFFEFYNNDSSSIPSSMDGFTLVTYFDQGPTKGFYVLDLPALFCAPRGFLVGSSANPFNYQGVSGSTSTNFSWNDLAFMAANNGYLKKWVLGTSNLSDGNTDYDEQPIPANFNDLFTKASGNGATYSVFVYQNGNLVNLFLGGTGGSTVVPSFITSMPALHIDMAGSSMDFDIDFAGYASLPTEHVIQDIGTDNGYIRTMDGFCNSWTKSSADVNHTPGTTNGPYEELAGLVAVSNIVQPGAVLTGSVVTYDAIAAPNTNMFPITYRVYIDNGGVFGQLDGGDTFIESNVEDSLSEGPFYTTFFPHDANVIIVVTTSVGCIDKIIFAPNASPLPLKLISFDAVKNESKINFKWNIAENQWGKEFELQKSTDGKNFIAENTILPSAKNGTEIYEHLSSSNNNIVYYRLKITDKNNYSVYSRIVTIRASENNSNTIRLFQNPVETYLSFTYTASVNTNSTLNIYNTSGAKVYSKTISLQKGENSIATALNGALITGTYILEIVSNSDRSITRFIKR